MGKSGKHGRLHSDAEVRKYAYAFLTDSLDALCKSKEEIITASRSLQFVMYGGKWFKTSPKVVKSLSKLVHICTKKLGPTSGHETDIEKVAWNIASTMDPKNIDDAVKDLIAKIEEQSKTDFRFIVPNFVVAFRDNIRELEVGPVKIRRSQTLPDDYVKSSDNVKWIVNLGVNPAIKSSEKGLEITYPSYCWEVNLASSPGNVEEIAFWLINIALSCIRFCYPPNHTNPLYPMWGKKEAHPTQAPVINNPSITVQTKHEIYSTGGSKKPNGYIIDNSVMNHFNEIDFEKFSNTIFNYKEKTVAESIAHGFGWMTRGRHAEDRSERFLFFYTAIEALVSTGDKITPVIQTIARNAASIITDSPEIRLNIATDIIKSYDIRSSLVHGGRRQVSHTESYKAQQLAERLYDAVISHIDLNKSRKAFLEDLKEASYGLPLPTM